MRSRVTGIAAIAALVVLGACGPASQVDRSPVVSLSESPDESVTPDAGTGAAIQDDAASVETSTASPATTEPAQPGDQTAGAPDEIEIDTDELDQVIADLDALLADLTTSFNPTEGDLQP